jgi:hypothetical protein
VQGQWSKKDASQDKQQEEKVDDNDNSEEIFLVQNQIVPEEHIEQVNIVCAVVCERAMVSDVVARHNACDIKSSIRWT